MTSERPPDLSVEAPGVSEESSVPWPLLLGQRLTARADEGGWYPWVVLATTLFGLLTITFTITILAVSIPGIAEDLGTDESTLTAEREANCPVPVLHLLRRKRPANESNTRG